MICAHKVTSGMHCARCHETFASIEPFDAHQELTDGEIVCLDPHTTRDAKGAQIWAPKTGTGHWTFARWIGQRPQGETL